MKVLVIGANGFLGSNLVKRCLDLNWNVDCVYHQNKENIPNGCRVINSADLESLDDSYNTIFLVAAFIQHGDFQYIDDRLLDINVGLTLRVIKKFKRSRIVFSSTCAVYGNHNLEIDENGSFNNPNLYGLSKIAAEFIIKSNPNHQIIRFPSIYGKGMNIKTFIPVILKQARDQKQITLFGDGSRLQNYVYIEDALSYLIIASKLDKSGVYLGVYTKSYSNADAAKIIQKLIPDCEIKYEKCDSSPSFVYNNSLTRKLLKFEPKYSLEKGIEDLLKNG